MRPERREWGPSVDIRDAEVVADIFRGLQDVVDGISVCVSQYGCDSDLVSLTISILGWNQLSAWLTALTPDLGPAVAALEDEGWISSDAERVEARELLQSLRSRCAIWSDFVDPDEPNLLELVADL